MTCITRQQHMWRWHATPSSCEVSSASFRYKTGPTCELTTRRCVRLPTSPSKPSVGASLKRTTKSCASISAPRPEPSSAPALLTTAHVGAATPSNLRAQACNRACQFVFFLFFTESWWEWVKHVQYVWCLRYNQDPWIIHLAPGAFHARPCDREHERRHHQVWSRTLGNVYCSGCTITQSECVWQATNQHHRRRHQGSTRNSMFSWLQPGFFFQISCCCRRSASCHTMGLHDERGRHSSLIRDITPGLRALVAVGGPSKPFPFDSQYDRAYDVLGPSVAPIRAGIDVDDVVLAENRSRHSRRRVGNWMFRRRRRSFVFFSVAVRSRRHRVWASSSTDCVRETLSIRPDLIRPYLPWIRSKAAASSAEDAFSFCQPSFRSKLMENFHWNVTYPVIGCRLALIWSEKRKDADLFFYPTDLVVWDMILMTLIQLLERKKRSHDIGISWFEMKPNSNVSWKRPQ